MRGCYIGQMGEGEVSPSCSDTASGKRATSMPQGPLKEVSKGCSLSVWVQGLVSGVWAGHVMHRTISMLSGPGCQRSLETIGL